MADESIVAGTSGEVAEPEPENSMDFTIEENLLLPVFKKTHISTRSVESFITTGEFVNYSDEINKRNALRQAATMFRLVNGELYRHGTDREYKKYGLRIVVHDDEPQKKLDILAKCHVNEEGYHLGMNNTIKKVTELYYWQGVSAHVKLFLKKCKQCKNRSKMDTDTWLEEEKKMLVKKRERQVICNEARTELRNLGRIKKPTPPETFFIVNAERKVNLDKLEEGSEMLIDSNNIEYVVETLGHAENGEELPEVCHVFNVPDIVTIPSRFRSREIENFLRSGIYPDDFTNNQKSGLRGPAAQYTMIDDEMYHEGNKKGSKGMRLVVHDDQPAFKVKIMVECHLDEDGTHLGLNRTMTRISEKYFWVGLSLDVRKFIMKCKVCMLTRGRKLIDSDALYADEVQKLRNKHMEKHGDTSLEEGYEEYEEISEVDQTDAEKAESFGQQIIRLVGPDEDVTEITVAVVNEDFASEGVTEQQLTTLTDTSAVKNAAENSSNSNDTATVNKEEPTKGKDSESEQYVKQVLTDNNGQVIEITYADDAETHTEENRVEEATAEETSAVEAAIGMIIDSEKDSAISTSVKAPEEMNEVELDTDHIESDMNSGINNEGNICVSSKVKSERRREEKENTHTVYQVNTDTTTTNLVSKSAAYSLYEDIIYVPKVGKTKAVEVYLSTKAVCHGYTTARLIELCQGYVLEDGILYRRRSQYKGLQIVIHDNNPKLKLKIIKECHLKANGKHFSEVLTLQNVHYKYDWDEVKWDVHRYYLNCWNCVREGEDVRLKRKVLSVEEEKHQANRKWMENMARGMSARRNREFRERHKTKFDKFKLWNKFGKEKGDYIADLDEEVMDEVVEHQKAVGENLDGTTAASAGDVESLTAGDDESDIEIKMPDSDDEAEKGSGRTKSKSKSKTDNQLYKMVLHATLEQEAAMRELFDEKDWNYKLEGLKKLMPDPEADTEAQKDALFQMCLFVRLEQEESVRKFFKTNQWQYSLEELEPVTPETPNSDTAVRTPASSGSGTPQSGDGLSPRKQRQKPERMTIMVNPEWEEETGSKGKKRSIEVETPVEGRRSSRREIKRPRRYSPDREEPKVRVKTETGTSPRQRENKNRQETPKKTNVITEETTTPKRQVTIKQGTTDNAKARTPVTKVGSRIIPSSPQKGLVQDKTPAQKKQSIQEFVPDHIVLVSEHEEEDEMDDQKLASAELVDQETDEDEDIADESDDDFEDEEEEEEDEEDSVKTINVFEDQGLPTSLEQVKSFQEKGLIKVCKICGKVFKETQNDEYEDHLSKHNSAQTFPCSSCSKVFIDSQSLQLHERVHGDMKQETCSLCASEFHTSFQLAAHMYKKHRKSNTFSCDICRAKFVNISFMKTEVLIDGELSFFKCVMCRR